MPFTGSHPAAILPFIGGALPASALVMGTLSPDIPYFLPGIMVWPTHNWWAIPTLDVLIALVAWVVWTGVLLPPALTLLPAAARSRLAEPVPWRSRVSSWRCVALLYAAFTLGAATHLFLDEFTHQGMWGDRHIGFLHDSWLGEPGWEWAQVLFSVAGLLVLMWWIARWWRTTPPVGDASPARYVWVVPMLTCVGAIVGLGAAAVLARSWHGAVFVGAAYGFGLAGFLAILLAGAWWVSMWGKRLGRR